MKPASAGRSSSASTGSKAGRSDVADPTSDQPAYHHYACQAGRRGLHRLRAAEPVYLQRRFPHACSARRIRWASFALLVHRAAARADPRLAGHAAGVDPQRIAFYGLSYGGKTAMRVPAICGAVLPVDLLGRLQRVDLEERLDCASPYSYVATGEYEMFEFDLGNTFNYAEMAGLIAPRPFMVERGHRDGVAPDEWVAYEYAKVRAAVCRSENPRADRRSNISTARTRSTAWARSPSCAST